MRAVDIIIKKRDGGELSWEELDFFIQGLAHGEIPDYQAAAWAMAVYFQGMTPAETSDLTLALELDSGWYSLTIGDSEAEEGNLPYPAVTTLLRRLLAA